MSYRLLYHFSMFSQISFGRMFFFHHNIQLTTNYTNKKVRTDNID